MSDLEEFCAAVADDLVGAVPALGEAEVHILAPYDPSKLEADNKMHLAIWPLMEAPEGGMEAATPLTTHAHTIDQLFALLVWEAALAESARRRLDTDATDVFFDLWEAVRARFFVDAHQNIGNSFRVWYDGSGWPDASHRVRFFQIRFGRVIHLSFQ